MSLKDYSKTITVLVLSLVIWAYTFVVKGCVNGGCSQNWPVTIVFSAGVLLFWVVERKAVNDKTR